MILTAFIPLIFASMTLYVLIPSTTWLANNTHSQSLWKACDYHANGTLISCMKINDVHSLTNSSSYHDIESSEITGATVLQILVLVFGIFMFLMYLCKNICGVYVMGMVTFISSLVSILLYVGYSQKYFNELSYEQGFWVALATLVVSFFSFIDACDRRRYRKPTANFEEL